MKPSDFSIGINTLSLAPRLGNQEVQVLEGSGFSRVYLTCRPGIDTTEAGGTEAFSKQIALCRKAGLTVGGFYVYGWDQFDLTSPHGPTRAASVNAFSQMLVLACQCADELSDQPFILYGPMMFPVNLTERSAARLGHAQRILEGIANAITARGKNIRVYVSPAPRIKSSWVDMPYVETMFELVNRVHKGGIGITISPEDELAIGSSDKSADLFDLYQAIARSPAKKMWLLSQDRWGPLTGRAGDKLGWLQLLQLALAAGGPISLEMRCPEIARGLGLAWASDCTTDPAKWGDTVTAACQTLVKAAKELPRRELIKTEA